MVYRGPLIPCVVWVKSEIFLKPSFPARPDPGSRWLSLNCTHCHCNLFTIWEVKCVAVAAEIVVCIPSGSIKLDFTAVSQLMWNRRPFLVNSKNSSSWKALRVAEIPRIESIEEPTVSARQTHWFFHYGSSPVILKLYICQCETNLPILAFSRIICIFFSFVSCAFHCMAICNI